MRKMLLAGVALAAGLPSLIAIADPVQSTRRQVAGGVSYRPLTTSTYDANARTVDLVAATETPVRMPGWRIGIEGDFLEILDMAGVDLSAVATGNVPLLDSHNSYELAARLGGVTAARTESTRLITTVRFGESEPASGQWSGSKCSSGTFRRFNIRRPPFQHDACEFGQPGRGERSRPWRPPLRRPEIPRQRAPR